MFQISEPFLISQKQTVVIMKSISLREVTLNVNYMNDGTLIVLFSS